MLPRQRLGVSHPQRLGFRQDVPRHRQFLKPRRLKAQTLGTAELPPWGLVRRSDTVWNAPQVSTMNFAAGCSSGVPGLASQLSRHPQWQELGCCAQCLNPATFSLVKRSS